MSNLLYTDPPSSKDKKYSLLLTLFLLPGWVVESFTYYAVWKVFFLGAVGFDLTYLMALGIVITLDMFVMKVPKRYKSPEHAFNYALASLSGHGVVLVVTLLLGLVLWL